MTHRPAITDVQLTNIEGCIRNALQKINRVRTADGELRKVAATPDFYAPAFRHSAEKEGRHADYALVTALDELKDLLAGLPLGSTPAASSDTNSKTLPDSAAATARLH